jgi:hypothetical protein
MTGTFSKRPSDFSSQIESFVNSRLPTDSPLRTDRTMIVKYPLCQLFTLEFLMAVFDLAWGHPDESRAIQASRDLATVDGLVWG